MCDIARFVRYRLTVNVLIRSVSVVLLVWNGKRQCPPSAAGMFRVHRSDGRVPYCSHRLPHDRRSQELILRGSFTVARCPVQQPILI